MRPKHKLLDQICTTLKELGAVEINIERARHYKLYWLMPDGSRKRLVVPITPGDWRSDQNTLADFRRILRGEPCQKNFLS